MHFKKPSRSARAFDLLSAFSFVLIFRFFAFLRVLLASFYP